MNKTLSIIIPVYNTEIDKLVTLFNSLEEQIVTVPIQVIVVDDGSTNDKTIIFLKNYTPKNIEYHLITKANGGVSSARNEGLKYVHGNYLTFIDSDDYISPNYASTIFKEFERFPNTQVLIFNWVDIKSSRKKINFFPLPSIKISQERAIKYLCKDLFYKGYPWNKAINLDTFSISSIPLFQDLKLQEDRLWSLELLSRTESIRIKNKAIYNYVYNDTSAINNEAKYYKIKADILNSIALYVSTCKKLTSEKNTQIALIQFLNQAYRDYFIFLRNNRPEVVIAEKNLNQICYDLTSNYKLTFLQKRKITNYYRIKKG